MYLQLIDLLNTEKINDNYLKKIYYFCCIIGGGDSIDFYMHKLVYKISKSINLNLQLYFYKDFSFENLLKNTEKYKNLHSDKNIEIFENFISKIKNNNIKSTFKVNKYQKDHIFIYDNSVNFRGFNQYINFNKVYQGNLCEYGRVNNYFINLKDIIILNKLKEIYKDKIETAIQCYLQIYQVFHIKNLFFYNHTSLFIERNICVDYGKYNKNCLKRTHNFKSNITTCLENYGDCREINLIKNLLILITEFDLFIKYFEENNFVKMEELIINHTRLISLNIFMKGHLEKPLPYVNNYLYNDKYLDEDDKLNKAELNKLKIIKGKKMIFLENHVLNLNINLKQNKLILHDLLYKKNNLIFDSENIFDYLYSADYYFDKVETYFDEKNKLLDLGVNLFNSKVIQLGEFSYNLFQTFKIENINPYDYYYLSNPYKLNKNFYNVNNFVIWREKKMYYNRIKYFNYKYYVERYTKPEKKYRNTYFLLEDF
jgi:hypothetical protein